MRISDWSSDVCSSDLGGAHHALGLGGEDGGHADEGGRAIAFQPLAAIDRADERAWAAEWIGALLAHEHVVVTPEIKESLWSALNSLATAPVEERTLTGLSFLLQSRSEERRVGKGGVRQGRVWGKR